MRNRPILFRGDMVRAILGDYKFETRRPLNQTILLKKQLKDNIITHDESWKPLIKFCPYGQPGDHLWVKETWRPYGWREENPILIQYRADKKTEYDRGLEYDPIGYNDWYENISIKSADECIEAGIQLKADEDGDEVYSWGDDKDCPIKWRPSIFMPRWCSRIDLEITDIRLERLKDITVAGCKAEGITWINPGPFYNPIREYLDLWDAINGNKYPSYNNPWLWVISFKRIRP